MKKRGIISVVLILLIIGLAGGVHIEMDSPYPEGSIIAGHPLSTNSHWYWYFNCIGCDHSVELACGNVAYDGLVSCPFVESKTALKIEKDTAPYGVDDLHECIFDRVPEPHNIRINKLGCLAVANENNDLSSDGCAYKYIHEGYIFESGGSADLLPNEPPAYTLVLETPFEIANVWGSSTEWTDYNGAALVLNIFRLDGGWSPDDTPGVAVPRDSGRPWQSNYLGDFICAYDYKWHGCDEGSVGRVIWAEQRKPENNFHPQTHLFICEEQDYLFHWVDKGTDNDHDGYVSVDDEGNDCSDFQMPVNVCERYSEVELLCNDYLGSNTFSLYQFNEVFSSLVSALTEEHLLLGIYQSFIGNVASTYAIDNDYSTDSGDPLLEDANLGDTCELILADNPLQQACSTPTPAFCSDIESVDDCDNDVKNYQCAICINPSAPEICGDRINNDCRGDGRTFGAAANELDGATPDSCDLFQQGCEAPSEGYLMDGEEYETVST